MVEDADGYSMPHTPITPGATSLCSFTSSRSGFNRFPRKRKKESVAKMSFRAAAALVKVSTPMYWLGCAYLQISCTTLLYSRFNYNRHSSFYRSQRLKGLLRCRKIILYCGEKHCSQFLLSNATIWVLLCIADLVRDTTIPPLCAGHLK